MKEKLSDDENQLLGAILDIAFNTGVEEGQQVVDAFFAGAEAGLTDDEQESKTWATLENIHNDNKFELCKAIIEGKWIRNGILNLPYIGDYFAVGLMGNKQKIDLHNSENTKTVEYVKLLWRTYDRMRETTDHFKQNLRYRPRRRRHW